MTGPGLFTTRGTFHDGSGHKPQGDFLLNSSSETTPWRPVRLERGRRTPGRILWELGWGFSRQGIRAPPKLASGRHAQAIAWSGQLVSRLGAKAQPNGDKWQLTGIQLGVLGIQSGTEGRHLEGIWEAFGRHLGGIWRHLRGI